tara:strand:- start:79 stop:306 length:228 start_codon:yes stop_codon:yes gene_type:complete
MEMKFDPRAKVKQGDLSSTPEGKQPNQAPGDLLISPSKEDVLANTGDGKFGYHEPKKFKSQLDANLFKMADEKDY